MSNELTIEQLKALPIGEWVWVNDTVEQIYSYMQNRQETIYNGKRETEICLETPSHYKRYSYSDYGKTWIAYKNKEEAEGEYDSQAVELEAVKQDKANLERTIEEINETLKDNGITIDSYGNVNDSRVDKAKKLVAKEILDSIYCVVNRFLDDDTLEYIFDSQYKKYGVEVDE